MHSLFSRNISIDEGGFTFDCLINEKENGAKYEVIFVSENLRARFTFSKDFFAASYPMGRFETGEPIAFFTTKTGVNQPGFRLTIDVYSGSKKSDQGGGINSESLRSSP